MARFLADEVNIGIFYENDIISARNRLKFPQNSLPPDGLGLFCCNFPCFRQRSRRIAAFRFVSFPESAGLRQSGMIPPGKWQDCGNLAVFRTAARKNAAILHLSARNGAGLPQTCFPQPGGGWETLQYARQRWERFPPSVRTMASACDFFHFSPCQCRKKSVLLECDTFYSPGEVRS